MSMRQLEGVRRAKDDPLPIDIRKLEDLHDAYIMTNIVTHEISKLSAK